jgi:hypothetical protein
VKAHTAWRRLLLLLLLLLVVVLLLLHDSQSGVTGAGCCSVPDPASLALWQQTG